MSTVSLVGVSVGLAGMPPGLLMASKRIMEAPDSGKSGVRRTPEEEAELHCHWTTVGKKKQLAIPGGRGNRQIGEENYGFLKAPFVEEAVSARQKEEALLHQGPVSSMDVEHVLDSAIAVLECGVDVADEAIAARVLRLHQLTAGRG